MEKILIPNLEKMYKIPPNMKKNKQKVRCGGDLYFPRIAKIFWR